jgi:hypothetical protein
VSSSRRLRAALAGWDGRNGAHSRSDIGHLGHGPVDGLLQPQENEHAVLGPLWEAHDTSNPPELAPIQRLVQQEEEASAAEPSNARGVWGRGSGGYDDRDSSFVGGGRGKGGRCGRGGGRDRRLALYETVRNTMKLFFFSFLTPGR